MVRLSRVGPGIVLAALATACSPAPRVESVWEPGHSHPARTEPAPPQNAAEPEDEALLEQMHHRLQTITAMRDELLLGEPEAARLLMEELADDLRTGARPAVWEELLVPMVADLEQARHLQSVDALAPWVARLAVGCGTCHRTLEASIALPQLTDPPEGRAPSDRMQQHLWAADRMWEGLIGPSTDRWVRGTTTFAVLPRCASEGESGSEPSPDRTALCTRVQSLVRHGHSETSTTGQGDVYGRLLTTCASCHALEQ